MTMSVLAINPGVCRKGFGMCQLYPALKSLWMSRRHSRDYRYSNGKQDGEKCLFDIYYPALMKTQI